jgi:predicted nucleic-acid-binding Zn-ribbon protein
MKHDRQCPKCRGRNVGYAVKPVGYSTSLMFADTTVASERWLCTDCGYVEIYATDLEHDWSTVLDVYFGAPKAGPFR